MDKIAIEKKWQKRWEIDKPFTFDRKNLDNKHYVLEMFSYPSAYRLHIGHWYNFGLCDNYARYQIMKGKNVFQPMGFDAFGLPSENYAIKNGLHPQDSTIENMVIMEKQLKSIGAIFDWDAEIKTCMPDYYKWTQWLFCQLYKKGLAYRKKAPVNFCPSCNTVLANEQVVDGLCERCDSEVFKKDLTQWFFKITEYADELLDSIDGLDWPEKTKAMQKNWIGKSVGSEIEFCTEKNQSFRVYTTRADTLMGCTYVVLAPEHKLVKDITTQKQKDAVEQYCVEVSKKTEIDRLSSTKEKTGVFTGAYAIHPLTGKKLEIWIGDYVLATYGTGAVMAVPAHDERDFEFAKKYGLEIIRVIKSADSEVCDDLPFVEDGVLVNSDQFDNLTSSQARQKITEKLADKNKGQLKTNFRLRDWLVSRQRYWGAPIPIVYCDDCGEVLEENLPVLLPYDVDFRPDGASPLKRHPTFETDCVCPKCKKPARREVDTLDTFVCSSWYFLRYPDNKNSQEAFDKKIIDKMLPVDKYIGGPEHACMHLLYARFITKALRDMGHLSFDEPFKSLVHQGIILGPDGNRMSKSHGNVVSPDGYVEKYGADAFRCYLSFAFKYIEGGPWSDDGIVAIDKWLNRVERFVLSAFSEYASHNDMGQAEQELNRVRHNTIKCVDEDLNTFSFNTAVARMMELVNAMSKYDSLEVKNRELFQDTSRDLVKMLCCFAPHISEELWSQIGGSYPLVKQKFPQYDQKALLANTVEILVQINSRPKTRMEIDSSLTTSQIEELVKCSQQVADILAGQQIKKIIVIPNRLVNIIV